MRKALSLFTENEWGSERRRGGGGGGYDLPKDKDVVSAKYSSSNSDLILGPYCESTTLCSSYIPPFRFWQFISEPVLVCLPNSPPSTLNAAYTRHSPEVLLKSWPTEGPEEPSFSVFIKGKKQLLLISSTWL